MMTMKAPVRVYARMQSRPPLPVRTLDASMQLMQTHALSNMLSNGQLSCSRSSSILSQLHYWNTHYSLSLCVRTAHRLRRFFSNFRGRGKNLSERNLANELSSLAANPFSVSSITGIAVRECPCSCSCSCPILLQQDVKADAEEVISAASLRVRSSDKKCGDYKRTQKDAGDRKRVK